MTTLITKGPLFRALKPHIRHPEWFSDVTPFMPSDVAAGRSPQEQLSLYDIGLVYIMQHGSWGIMQSGEDVRNNGVKY
jgi:hypothetical protein